MADTVAKVFCITDCKFSGPYVRRSNNHLRDYIILPQLTGDFGNGLEAISLCDFGSFSLFGGNWQHGIFGVLQHYRHETDMPTLLRNFHFRGQSGKHLLALLLELMTSVHWVKADIAVASVEI